MLASLTKKYNKRCYQNPENDLKYTGTINALENVNSKFKRSHCTYFIPLPPQSITLILLVSMFLNSPELDHSSSKFAFIARHDYESRTCAFVDILPFGPRGGLPQWRVLQGNI